MGWSRGWKPQLCFPSSQIPQPSPILKQELQRWGTRKRTPLLLGDSGPQRSPAPPSHPARPRPGAICLIVPARRPLRSPRPAWRKGSEQPEKGMGVRDPHSLAPHPSRLGNNSPCLLPSPSSLPIAKAEPTSTPRRLAGAVQMLRGGGLGVGGWGRSRGLRPSPSRSPAPQRDSGYTGTTQPCFLRPYGELLGCGPSPSPGLWRRSALGPLVPRSRKRPRAGCRSHHMLLTPTVSVPAVLGHGGLGTGGGEALSLRWLFSPAAGYWQWEALCPRWAQLAETLRMLLWRWWEGVGRRREEKADEPSSASQARVHTNTSVTPSLPQPTRIA